MANASTPQPSALDDLVSLWQRCREEGRETSPAELCRDCPELLAELQRRLAVLRQMSELAGSLHPTATLDLPAAVSALPADSDTHPPQAVEGQTFQTYGREPNDLFPAPPLRVCSANVPCPPEYEILGELGRGGMGVVYQARHRQLGRIVALKMILTGGYAGVEDVARFLAEARAAAELRHPNLVQLYEFGKYNDLPYFTLEFMACGSLHGKLRQGPLLPGDAAQLVEQLARGMAHAHQHGIVHRDLKPHNVLLTEDGTPKITDFGLVKRLETEQGATVSGAVMGTPSYMAPEQASDSKRVGPAADVYALGTILYECLTGRPPFQGPTVLDTLKLVLDTEPVPPRRLQPAVPRDLETVCLKCLRKQPTQRYATALELAEDLRRYQAGEPIRARPMGRVEASARWVRRRPLQATLAAALALLLVVGTGAAFLYQQASASRTAERLRQEFVAKEVEATLSQAEESRYTLYARLTDPRQAHVLLSDLHPWAQTLDQAETLRQKAQVLADSDGDGLSPQLRQRLQALQQELLADQQTYQLAVQLDTIRQEASLVVEGKYDPKRAGPEYAQALAQAGWEVEQEDTTVLAEKVRDSAARYAVVAALDHWADLTTDAALRSRLLAVARQVDPDGWRDQVRDPRNWTERETLQALARQVQVAEQSPQVLILLAARLRSQHGDGVALLRQAQLAYPQDFWLNFTLGQWAPLAAEKAGCYHAALALRPDSVIARVNLGVALFDQKDYAGALACYHKAIQINPISPVAHCQMGRLLRAQNDRADAIAYLKKAIEFKPNYVYAYNCLGWVHYEQKDYAGARRCYEQALHIDPKYVYAHNNLGLVFYDQKEYPQASACFEKAIELNPKYVHAHNNLGRVFYVQNEYPRAIACYREAIQIDPSYTNAHRNLGLALQRTGDWAGARQALARCLHLLSPTDAAYPKVQQHLQQCEDRLRKQKDAAVQKSLPSP